MKERDQELVKQAGLYLDGGNQRLPLWVASNEELTRFADLIRVDERKACVKIVELEAMQYSEPVWAFEIVNDILARGNTNG